MITSRGAFFLGLSLIVCTSLFIYGPQIGNLRYLTIPTTQGLFILDTKNQVMNVCTEKSCRVVPHEASSTFIPGMQPTYGQMPMLPTNSLGIMENTSVPGLTCGNGMCVMPVPQQQNIQAQQPKPMIVEARTEAQQIVPLQPQPAPVPVMETPQRVIAQQRPVVQPMVRPMLPVQRPMVQAPAFEKNEPDMTGEVMAPRPIAPTRPIAASSLSSVPNPVAVNRVDNDMAQLEETEKKLFG